MKRITVSAALFLVFLPALLTAQTFTMSPAPKNTFQMEIRTLMPQLNEDRWIVESSSAVFDVNVYFHLKKGLRLNVIVPIAKYRMQRSYSLDDILYTYNHRGLGNIFIGLQSHRSQKPGITSSATFGIYLNTMGKGSPINSIYGVYADGTHWTKFAADMVTLSSNINYFNNANPHYFFGCEAGPDLYIRRDDSNDKDIVIRYGAAGGLKAKRTIITGEYTGYYYLRNVSGGMWYRIDHYLTAGATLKTSWISPGVFVQFPLRKVMQETVENIIGFKLNFN